MAINDVERIVRVFREVTAQPVEDDGLIFPPDAITGSGKARQWEAFLNRSGLSAQVSLSLEEAAVRLRDFLLPPLQAAARDEELALRWSCSATAWVEEPRTLAD